jgi:transaldolase
MLVQARVLSACAPNIVVKIPVITETGEPCFEVMHRLEREGIRVNATACLAFGQAMLAAKAGATYVSLFAGRIADEGHEPGPVIAATRRWVDMWGGRTKIIAASIRGVTEIQAAALAGAHVLTIPPAILSKLADHKYTRSTVHEFVRDAKAASELANLALLDEL